MDLLGSSAIVETAIGLALVFFLGAGVCTAVVEAVAGLGQFRAKLLWRGVARWFSTVDDADARRAVSRAASLCKTDVGAAFKAVAEATAASVASVATAAEAAEAAEAEADAAAATAAESDADAAADADVEPDDGETADAETADAETADAEATGVAVTPQPEPIAQGGALRARWTAHRERWNGRPPDIETSATGRPRAEFFAALPGVVDAEESLRKTKSINREAAIAALSSVFAATTELDDEHTEVMLGRLIARTPDAIRRDLEARARWIERWFDAEMDRLAAAYRSRIRWFAALVAVLLVGLLGLDAIDMATQLYKEPDRRQVLVAAAEAEVTDQDAAPCTDADGTTTTAAPESTSTSAPQPVAAVRSRLECARHLVDDIEGFQIGRWTPTDHGWDKMPPKWGERWIALLGMAISIAAFTAGAPWWFAVLKKLMEVRKVATTKT